MRYTEKCIIKLCIFCLICLFFINYLQQNVHFSKKFFPKIEETDRIDIYNKNDVPQDKSSTTNMTKLKTSNPYLMGKVISRKVANGWNTINNEICNKIDNNFVLAHLKTPPDTPIYVYPKSVDHYVSSKIIDKGWQEKDNTEMIISYMKRFPDAIFLDLGANIGAFSITIAALGFKVIAVECLRQNVMRMCASMEKGGLTNRMIIIHNAVTDRHEKVSLRREPGNIGMTRVDSFSPEKESIDTIMLDDLLEIYNFTQVVMKMDVEQFEDIVLKGAYRFFKLIKVEAVLMEWVYHRADRYNKDGKFIVDFLDRHGLEPDVPEKFKHDHTLWYTYEVLFKRKNENLSSPD